MAQAPAPESQEEGGPTILHVAATLTFGGLALTFGGGSGYLVVELMAAAAVAAALVGMVVAAIWGRPSGQNAFFAVVFAAFGFLLLVRVGTTPNIGLATYDAADGWVMVSGASGEAADAGIPVPSYLTAIEGKAVHSSAEVRAIVARHRALDTIRVTAVSGIDPVIRNYDIIVGK